MNETKYLEISRIYRFIYSKSMKNKYIGVRTTLGKCRNGIPPGGNEKSVLK